MKKTLKVYPIPKFTSIEEEHAFWETHDPLTEGYEGREYVPKPGAQRIRSTYKFPLDTKAIDKLYRRAEELGVGMDDLIHLVLAPALEAPSLKGVAADELKQALEQAIATLVERKARPARSKLSGEAAKPRKAAKTSRTREPVATGS